MFAYGPQGTEMDITVDTNLTYSEPAAIDKSWNVVLKKNGLKANGKDRPYLYYEYEAVDFERPEAGWVVEKNQIHKLSKQIASSMEMNAVEAVRLNFELKHAMADVSSDRIFVGMIDQAEVDTKLPMNVSPMPEAVARYHFYVGAAEGEVTPPLLLPIDRVETMLLEIGAAGFEN